MARSIDLLIFRFFNDGWGSAADTLMIGLTAIATYAWIAAVVVPIGWRYGSEKIRRFCALALPVVLLSDSLPNLIKVLVARPRPFEALESVRLIVPAGRLSDYGFPSNHAANVFAVATLLWCVFRWRAGIPGAVIATLVALSRVYVGVHYPSDVVAGALLGILIGLGAHEAYRRADASGRAFARTAVLLSIIGAGILVQVIWRALGQR